MTLRRVLFHAFALCAFLTLLCATGPLLAQTSWNTTTGSWFNDANWNPVGVPAASYSVFITNGGTAQIGAPGAVSNNAYIGNGASQTGTVEVLNTGTWDITSLLYVGNYGTGTLKISGTGEVSSANGFVGYEAGSHGTVEISGGKWTSTSLYVALSGTAKLLISGTGEVISTDSQIGSSDTGKGTVEVSGGKWTSDDTIYTGYAGTGTLEISGTGVVEAKDGIYLAYMDGSSGTLTLRGDATSRGVLLTSYVSEGLNNNGAKVTFDGGILRASRSSSTFIANFEAGDVQIRNGGAYIDTNGFNVTIRAVLQDAVGQEGSLFKQGAGTLTLTGVNTYVGGTTVQQGTLTLGDGTNPAALVVLPVDGRTAVNLSATTTFNVAVNATVTGGSGSSSGDGGDLGGDGVSAGNGASVFNSGIITGGVGGLGDHDGGPGGAGVRFTAAGEVVNAGTITGGSTGNNSDSAIKFDGPGGVGVILGSGGTLTNTGTVSGGLGGRGMNDQHSTDDDASAVMLGNNASLVNSGTISGGLSGGNGSRDGYAVYSTIGAVSVENKDGGVINGKIELASLANTITLHTGSIINGDLNIGTDIGAKLILTGISTGTGVYSTAVTGSTIFSGALTVTGGTWTLDEVLSHTGGTTVSGGTLLVEVTLGAGDFAVKTGGTLGGSGTIGGSVTVTDGTIAAGSSPGTLTIDGGLNLSSASILHYELGSPSGTPGVDSDLIVVGGALALNGTLNITNAGGLDSGTYTLISYAGGLSGPGLTLGALRPAGYNFTVDTTTTTGSVLLNVDFDGLQFWDGSNFTDNSAVEGGAGTWNNSLTNWTNASGNFNTNWQNLTAVFQGTAGVVEVTADVTVGGMQFATDGYEIQSANGSTITLGSMLTEVLVDPDATVTIGAELTGAAALVKSGLGTLVLTGTNTYGSTLVTGGTLRVDGATASIGQANSALGVDGPEATLIVANGATVTSSNSTISGNTGSSGKVVVTGGKWTNSAIMAVGLQGTGTLEISGTGEVSANQAIVGNFNGSKGIVDVSGGKWTVTSDLYLGALGVGELHVSGGEVISSSTVLGGGSSATGLAEVSGGKWTNSGDLVVGSAGTGTVTIAGSGVVTVGVGGAGVMTLAEEAGSKGTLNIGAGSAAGTLEAASVHGDSGTAKVVFNHNATAYAFAPLLTGSLAVDVLAGTTILSQAHTYTGFTTIKGGTLVVSNTTGSATGAAEVRAEGGRLAGSGFIDGIVRFTGAASMSPGHNSIGTLTLGGLVMRPDTVLDFELHTPDVAGNGVNDLLEVTGDLTLDGLLNIIDIGDFGTYRIINYGGSLTNNGLAVNNVPAGVNPGGFFVDATIAGQVNLIYQFADVQYWDGSNLQGNGRVDGGSGVWAAGVTNWTNLQGLINGPWAGQTAVFTSQPGTITLGSDIPFQKLIFAVSGYRIESPQGYKLYSAGDATIQVNTGRAAIAAPLVIDGSFFKTGSGLLELRSTASAAATFIQSGSLAVNGTLQSPYVGVSHRAILQGTGLIVGNVFNSGTVAPGNSIGTLTIHGNYTQRSNGTLQIEVASTSHHDVLAVSGTAKLAGTLEVRSLGYKPKYGDQIPFLVARRITGKFSDIDMPNPDRFRGRFLHEGGVGVLLVAPTSYTLVARTGNEHNLAGALDKWIGIESGDIGDVTLALDLLGEDQYAQAFAAIGPAFIEGALSTATELSQSHTQMLHQQLSARRLANRIANVPATPAPVVSGKGAKAVAPQVAPAPDDARWSAWVQGSGLFSSGGLSLVPGEDFESGTILVGADYLITEHIAVGLFASYQEGWGDYDFAGDIDVESVRFGAYATVDYGGFYANAAIGGGQTGFDIDRPIQWATLSRLARSEPDGYEFFTSLGAGYDHKVGNWTFGPQVTLQYNKVSLDEFKETGAGVLNLRLHEAEMESLRSYLGGRVAYTLQVNERFAIIPEVRVFWQHEFMGGDQISAALDSGSGPAFIHRTNGPDEDSVYIGAGVGFQIGDHFYGNIYYNVDLGRNDEENQTVSISATWKF